MLLHTVLHCITKFSFPLFYRTLSKKVYDCFKSFLCSIWWLLHLFLLNFLHLSFCKIQHGANGKIRVGLCDTLLIYRTCPLIQKFHCVRSIIHHNFLCMFHKGFNDLLENIFKFLLAIGYTFAFLVPLAICLYISIYDILLLQYTLIIRKLTRLFQRILNLVFPKTAGFHRSIRESEKLTDLCFHFCLAHPLFICTEINFASSRFCHVIRFFIQFFADIADYICRYDFIGDCRICIANSCIIMRVFRKSVCPDQPLVNHLRRSQAFLSLRRHIAVKLILIKITLRFTRKIDNRFRHHRFGFFIAA